MCAAVARLSDLAIGPVLRWLAVLGCVPRNLPGDDAARQKHRPRSVGAVGNEVKAKRLGQDLVLSDGLARGPASW